MTDNDAQLVISLAPWLLVLGPLAGAIIIYLLPKIPWGLIAVLLVGFIVIKELLL